MKYIDSEIDQYWIHFQAGHAESKKVYPEALIKCYNGDDYLVQLTFYPNGKKLPENHYDKRNKLVYLRYPMSMYANILDILRNEKPIFFRYNAEIKLGFIRTGKEPVGEGEYDADFQSA
ncbi:hypothetical protein [Robiginitalea sp. SC105]|uniref:hypothetical protein n=1 Tax=Robiginitalea sp. SC105 TaxID=2762332 RepID=UPI001639EC5B|nr:hypothetical protein [Robiginitalea sp. SC105]MBC2838463.1 hypothetical protein [Robiginitalea sp. SC105]